MKLSDEKIDIIQKVIGLEDGEKPDQIHELLADEHDQLTESEKRSIERGLRTWMKAEKFLTRNSNSAFSNGLLLNRL